MACNPIFKNRTAAVPSQFLRVPVPVNLGDCVPADSLKLPFLRIFHFDDYANLLILNPNENIAVSISGLFIGF